MFDGGTLSTAVPVLLTLLAFGTGVLVGWLWWGRRFVRARLTREEALSIMQSHVERELAATDAKIARLQDDLGPAGPRPGTDG